MPKRFTDSDKWKKKWFRCLSNDHKVFWIYVLDQCDHAGIWEVDFEAAEFFCSGIDEQEIRQVFKKQFQEVDNGKRWFLKDFVDFQYGTLNENNRAHLSVINILKKYKLIKNKDLVSPLNENNIGQQGYKDKEQVKDLVKVKEKETKAEQIKKIKVDLPIIQKDFPSVDVANEYEKWIDDMKKKGKIWKNYRAAFRNWLRSPYVAEVKTTLKDIKTDTGGFYLGKCSKCSETNSYDKSEIFQDSRCCKAEIHPIRNVPTSQKNVRPVYNLEGNDVLRRKDGGKQGAVYD